MLLAIKAAISLCVAVILISCVSIDPIDPQNEYPTQPAVVTDSNETTNQEPLKKTPGASDAQTVKEEKADKAPARRSTAEGIALTALVTVLAITEITNIVKEKVVPVVLTLVFVGVVVSTVIHTDPKAE